MSIISDYAGALRMAHQARTIQKKGELTMMSLVTPPKASAFMPGWLNTVEGSVLSNRCPEISKSIKELVFNRLSYEQRHDLLFSPKRGEHAARVRFWRQALNEVIPDADRMVALAVIIRWFRHCVHIDMDKKRLGFR